MALSPATLEWYRARGARWLRERATVTWERPAEGLQVFGLGTAIRVVGLRSEGLSGVRATVEQTLGRFASRADREVPAPLVFAGAAFDPAATVRDAVWDAFGGWQVLVPAITIVRRGERWSGWACAGDFPVSACEVPPDLGRAASTDLRAAVTQAVGEIRSGAYEKVVLAGSRVVPLGSTTPADVLERLCQAFPSCAVFSLRSGGLTWLGASPEPLARCEAGRAELVSLAGSRRRGRDAAEDLRLEQELLTSAKERWEHRLVVEAIASEAQDLLEEPCISATPEVMKLANIQHLRTPISGQLARGVSILDLVERLHPTPAVGGWPRVHALDAIRRLERMDRGWYAGPIGWVDAAGNGEFVVGLRTALLGSSEARLYAGAGIVADSDPAAELEEIETKLDALRGVIST